MILAMKKVRVFALRSDRDAILKSLQRHAVMMIESTDATAPDDRLDEARRRETEAADAIKYLAPYSNEKSGLLTPLPEVGLDAIIASAGNGAIAAEARAIRDEAAGHTAEITAWNGLLKQAAPWADCPLTAADLAGTASCTVFTGYLPGSAAAQTAQAVDELAAVLDSYGVQGTYQAVSAVCLRAQAGEVLALLKRAGFMSFSLPAEAGTMGDYIRAIEHKIADAQARIDTLTDRARELGGQTGELKLFYDSRKAECDRYAAPVATTDATFYLTGWVLEERQEEVAAAVAEATDVYEVELSEPADGEQPPTQVRNNRLVEPFETITDMFSRPNPNEGIDPNPVMAPWYWIIFGMMMADAGYGLLMAIMFGVYLKFKKPRGDFGKLVRVLLYSSVTTAIWGVLFGSYFGESLLPPVLFAPLENPMPMLLLSFALGALHIFCGLIVNAVEHFRHGEWQQALGCDFGWIILIVGLPLMVLPATADIGKYMALGGLALILLFTGGGVRSPFKRLMAGVSSLTGVTGYMSDILSYSRIVALMLASGVVAMVMNILAGMVADMPVVGIVLSLAVYAVGHIFNLVLGLLSAYVHASRLQYIEFFGKFYEGGGYLFEPLSYRPTYSVLSETK